VVFREGTVESRIDAINESVDVEVMRKMLSGRIHLIRLPKDKSLEKKRRAYLFPPAVETVEVSYKIRGQQSDN